MTDRYENIRRALAMGPTHGPWHATKPEPHGTEVRGPAQVSLAWCGGATTVGEEGCYSIGAAEAAANAHFIAACEPDTIRELLAERDQLAAALEAAREDADKLRVMLRTVSAVGVVQLFDTARDDVLAEFSHAELQEIVRVTEHKRPEQVERIYREGWDAAIDQARGDGVGEVA